MVATSNIFGIFTLKLGEDFHPVWVCFRWVGWNHQPVYVSTILKNDSLDKHGCLEKMVVDWKQLRRAVTSQDPRECLLCWFLGDEMTTIFLDLFLTVMFYGLGCTMGFITMKRTSIWGEFALTFSKHQPCTSAKSEASPSVLWSSHFFCQIFMASMFSSWIHGMAYSSLKWCIQDSVS